MRWLIGTLGIGIIIVVVVLVFRHPNQPSNTNSTSNTTNTATTNTTKYHGVSFSPRSTAPEDFKGFFDAAAQAGTMVTWAGDIADLAKANSAPRTIAQLSEQHQLLPVSVAVVPVATLANEATRQEAKLAAINFVETMKPKYFGLGNEVNFEYKDDTSAFTNFVHFFTETRAELKKVSPDTKVFTVWQLEWLKGLHGGLFGGMNDPDALSQWYLLDQFPEADFFAFTSYPTLIYPNPSDIPENYYSEISTYSNKPIAYTEVGWLREGPKGWESSSAEQVEFIHRFDQLTQAQQPLFSVWPFLYPQNVAWPFSQIYLLPADQDTIPALEAWKLVP